MASFIGQPRLSISLNNHTQVATVRVDFTLRFTAAEINVMQQIGEPFLLACHLYGNDEDELPKGKNDLLFKFWDKKIKTSQTQYSAYFETLLSFNILNEDTIIRPEDEIYALLTLTHPFYPNKPSIRSNEITREFAR